MFKPIRIAVLALLGASALLLQACKPSDTKTAYLFAYFNDNTPEGEQIRFAVSRNGYDYTPLNNGERVVDLDNYSRWKCVRDPHILRGEDGHSFYMVATDMKSSEGWSSNDGIVMMKSKDLVNWSAAPVDFPTVFPDLFTRDGLTRVWAPQTIWDAEAGKYMVYYSLEFDHNFLTIYYSYANDDFTSLSAPEKLVDFQGGHIDADIVEKDGVFHMFLAGICKSTAPSLKGPWSQPDRRKRYQMDGKAAEGPGVFKLNDSDEWILMYDCHKDGCYQFCKSTDLENFTLVAERVRDASFSPRHGTVIGITEKELESLLKAFPTDGLTAKNLGK